MEIHIVEKRRRYKNVEVYRGRDFNNLVKEVTEKVLSEVSLVERVFSWNRTKKKISERIVEELEGKFKNRLKKNVNRKKR